MAGSHARATVGPRTVLRTVPVLRADGGWLEDRVSPSDLPEVLRAPADDMRGRL
ncbi:hypothetical protein ACIPUC_10515 [Streptomyces sp. LARHCF249]